MADPMLTGCGSPTSYSRALTLGEGSENVTDLLWRMVGRSNTGKLREIPRAFGLYPLVEAEQGDQA